MRRFAALIAVTMCLAVPAWSQDSDTEAEPAAAEADAAPSETEPEPESSPPTEDLAPEGNYADSEEDDFRPSEDIPADQSIPFPTDI